MVLRVKELRSKTGLSQGELADKLKVNQTAISQWERETALPSCEKLPELAAALGVRVGELFVEASPELQRVGS